MFCTRQLLLLNQNQEELLTENPERWVMFPIKYHSIWKLYKNAQNSFWAAENFRFINDIKYFKSIDPLIIQSIMNILQYHVENDNETNTNSCTITCELIKQVQIPEARAFYGFQIMFENVHSEAIGTLLNTLNQSSLPITIPSYKKIWSKVNLDKGLSFFEQIFCNLLVKVIFSTGLFMVKDYLVRKNVCSETLGALEKIENDLEIQAQFATTLIKMLKFRPEESIVYEYLNDAINTEFTFLKSTVNFEKMEINSDHILTYLKATGDNILNCIEYNPHFSVLNKTSMKILNMSPILNLKVEKKVDHGRQEVVLDEEF